MKKINVWNMTKLSAISLLVAVFGILSSCSKDDNPPAISVTNNQTLTQEVYADDEQGKSDVSFTTTSAWTSRISTSSPNGQSGQMNAPANSSDWVSISPDRGNAAGNYTIAISLEVNTTGANRTATITILCNGDEIKITVTQKGTTKDGDVPGENEETKLRALLVKLYNDTNGDGWTNKTNWLSDKPINEWFGIIYSPEYLGIDLYDNNLTGTIDLSGCTALIEFGCTYNSLTSLNVSGCTALTTLYCGGNQLTTLNVKGCTALEAFACWRNKLTSLDASGCSALTYLDCSFNQLTNLDVSDCSALVFSNLIDNQLISLDLGDCSKLTTLYCGGNQLTTLNVNGCTALEAFDCWRNKLTSLDVSGCTALRYVVCDENQLTNTALNTLFGMLPVVTTGDIAVFNNPGAATCNPSIAEAKGWSVSR